MASALLPHAGAVSAGAGGAGGAGGPSFLGGDGGAMELYAGSRGRRKTAPMAIPQRARGEAVSPPASMGSSRSPVTALSCTPPRTVVRPEIRYELLTVPAITRAKRKRRGRGGGGEGGDGGGDDSGDSGGGWRGGDDGNNDGGSDDGDYGFGAGGDGGLSAWLWGGAAFMAARDVYAKASTPVAPGRTQEGLAV